MARAVSSSAADSASTQKSRTSRTSTTGSTLRSRTSWRRGPGSGRPWRASPRPASSSRASMSAAATSREASPECTVVCIATSTSPSARRIAWASSGRRVTSWTSPPPYSWVRRTVAVAAGMICIIATRPSSAGIPAKGRATNSIFLGLAALGSAARRRPWRFFFDMPASLPVCVRRPGSDAAPATAAVVAHLRTLLASAPCEIPRKSRDQRAEQDLKMCDGPSRDRRAAVKGLTVG